MIKVYGTTGSGNCYKVKLICELLKISYKWIEIDTRRGETRTASFLKINPNGKVPAIVLEDGEIITESNAILFYLSQQSAFWPTQLFEQAKVLQWMFFEQYSHEPYVAVARAYKIFHPNPASVAHLIPDLIQKGNKALQVMESTLSKQSFMVGNRCTIADISLFAYTHVAHEGGFDLAQFPAIQKWCQRIQSQIGDGGINNP